MKILLDTCACIFYVSDNVMTRVHLANNILVHIVMLLFKSHPVYRQLKKLVKNIRAHEHGPSFSSPAFSRPGNFAQSWLKFCQSFSSPAFSRPRNFTQSLLKCCPSFSSPAFSGRAFSVAPLCPRPRVAFWNSALRPSVCPMAQPSRLQARWLPAA